MTKAVTQDYTDQEEARTRKPVEFYHIYREGGDEHWYYTSGDIAVTFDGNVYTPATMERDAIEYNSDMNVTTVKVRAAFITDPIIDFIVQNPVEVLWIQIMKLHRDQDPLEANVLFTGQMKSVTIKGAQGEAEVVGFEWYFKQQIPRYRFQPGCNNTLYDDYCTINKASFTHAVTVSGVSADGLTLTSGDFDALADDYLVFGYIAFNDNLRLITSHTGNTIEIRYRIIGLTAGASATVYAGCDLKAETCRDKFNNINNFFGHPYIPVENPATRT